MRRKKWFGEMAKHTRRALRQDTYLGDILEMTLGVGGVEGVHGCSVSALTWKLSRKTNYDCRCRVDFCGGATFYKDHLRVLLQNCRKILGTLPNHGWRRRRVEARRGTGRWKDDNTEILRCPRDTPQPNFPPYVASTLKLEE